ncbi:MAG: hypothetical protein AAGE03_09335 [Pseudomonadota bacterium]
MRAFSGLLSGAIPWLDDIPLLVAALAITLALLFFRRGSRLARR